MLERRAGLLSGADASNFVHILIKPFRLDISASSKVPVILGAYRKGEIPLMERSARLAFGLGIGEFDALVMIATIDEVLDDKVFDRVSFCDIRLLRLFHDYGGFEGRSDIDCIIWGGSRSLRF